MPGSLPAFHADLDAVIPPDERFILVDRDELALDHPRALPFTERNGQFWGFPADDPAAIAEVQRQRSAGIHFLVIPSTALWVLQHYHALHAYLILHARLSLQTDRMLIFDLRG